LGSISKKCRFDRKTTEIKKRGGVSGLIPTFQKKTKPPSYGGLDEQENQGTRRNKKKKGFNKKGTPRLHNEKARPRRNFQGSERRLKGLQPIYQNSKEYKGANKHWGSWLKGPDHQAGEGRKKASQASPLERSGLGKKGGPKKKWGGGYRKGRSQKMGAWGGAPPISKEKDAEKGRDNPALKKGEPWGEVYEPKMGQKEEKGLSEGEKEAFFLGIIRGGDGVGHGCDGGFKEKRNPEEREPVFLQKEEKKTS